MNISEIITQKLPLVSIGLPTYNRPDSLRHTLECITRQTYPNLEIIVSDNASPEQETEQVIKSFKKRDERIRYFRQEINIGANDNFKFVLNEARGKYFVWFADDDSCDVNFITELVSCLEKSPDIALAMCDVSKYNDSDPTVFDEHLNLIRIDKVENDWRAVRKHFFSYPTSNIFFCIYGLYRTDILKTCKVNFVSRWKEMSFNSEVPFLAQIAVRGRIVSVPKNLKTYVSHSDSLYVKEMKRINRLDRWIRRFEVRISLMSIAIQSDLPLEDRLILFIHSLIPAKPV